MNCFPAQRPSQRASPTMSSLEPMNILRQELRIGGYCPSEQLGIHVRGEAESHLAYILERFVRRKRLHERTGPHIAV